MKTLLLNREEVRSLLTMETAMEAVERALAAHGRGETIMPSKVYLPLEKYSGDFRAMPAYFEGSAGVKWVNAHPKNPAKHGLPAVMGLYILSDPDTAVPLAVMDATLLTGFRTGAVGGVASKHLAKPSPATIGFIGCGVQAGMLLSAHRTLYSFRALMADRSPEAAARFAKEGEGEVATVEEAAGCDIVCTSTPSRSPILQREWIRAGTHINAMGADAPGKQELDPKILTDARVLVDGMDQATESGEVNVPLHAGDLRRDQISGTIGEVIAGARPGREGDEITVFDSTGLAIQDVALARRVYDEARSRGVGHEVEFM